MIEYSGIIKFDFDLVSQGLNLSRNQTNDFFVDGRKFSFLVENIVGNFDNFEKSPNENLPYDVIYLNNTKIEIRCLTKKIIFRPSSQIGSGRKFNKELFKSHKIDKIDYFMIFDLNCDSLYDNMSGYWYIDKDEVWKNYLLGILGKNVEISRSKFLSYLGKEIKWVKEI